MCLSPMHEPAPRCQTFLPATIRSALMIRNAQRAAAPVYSIVFCSIGAKTGMSPFLGYCSPDFDLVGPSTTRGRFYARSDSFEDRIEVASCILARMREGSAGAKGGAGEGVVGLFRSGIFRASICAFMRAV